MKSVVQRHESHSRVRIDVRQALQSRTLHPASANHTRHSTSNKAYLTAVVQVQTSVQQVLQLTDSGYSLHVFVCYYNQFVVYVVCYKVLSHSLLFGYAKTDEPIEMHDSCQETPY